jgi:hypothetical protein
VSSKRSFLDAKSGLGRQIAEDQINNKKKKKEKKRKRKKESCRPKT